MYSTSGEIGGFKITADSIASTNGLVGLYSGDINNGDTIRFWAGSSNRASAPFQVTQAGAMYASKGTIGGFTITLSNLYAGNIENMYTSKNNYVYMSPSSIRVSQGIGYSAPGDIANLKVLMGYGADPSMDKSNSYCNCAMYIYRSMNPDLGNKTDYYWPAVRVVSENVVNRNIAMRLQGGLQVWGGVIEKGHILNMTSQGIAYLVDLSFGTTFLTYNTSGGDAWISLPGRTNIINQLGIDYSDTFCVPVTVVNTNKSNGTVYLKLENYEKIYNQNGDEWRDDSSSNCQIKLSAGDSIRIALCYVGGSFFGQVITESR